MIEVFFSFPTELRTGKFAIFPDIPLLFLCIARSTGNFVLVIIPEL